MLLSAALLSCSFGLRGVSLLSDVCKFRFRRCVVMQQLKEEQKGVH